MANRQCGRFKIGDKTISFARLHKYPLVWAKVIEVREDGVVICDNEFSYRKGFKLFGYKEGLQAALKIRREFLVRHKEAVKKAIQKLKTGAEIVSDLEKELDTINSL